MANTTVEAPDGVRYEVFVPEGKTDEDARQWFKKEYKAGRIDPASAISQTPTEEDKATMWEEFKAGFGRADTDVSNLSIWLESRMPLGQVSLEGYQSPEDVYGKEFMQMSPDQRRQFLLKNREGAEQAEYGDAGKEGTAALFGNIAGSLMSPSSLAPVGTTYKGATAVGAGLGAAYSSIEDLAFEGTVDPFKTAMYAGAGGAMAPATIFAGRTLGKIAEKGIDKFRINTQPPVQTPSLDVVPEPANGGPVIKDELPFQEWEQPPRTPEEIEKEKFFNKPQDPIPQDSSGTPKILPKERGVVAKTVDDFIGNISTRVKNISVPVFGKLREFEFNTHVRAYDTKAKVEPFLKSMHKMGKDDQVNMSRYLYNGQFDEAKALMAKEAPGMVKEFEAVQDVLSTLYMDLKDAGYDHLGFIENYYPRYVKDVPGLLNSLGKKERSIVEVALERKAQSLGKKDKSQLTADEETQVINSVLRGYSPKETSGRLGFAKSRSIDQLTDAQLQFYSSPVESLDAYIGRAVNDIEKRRFFGKTAKVEGGRMDLDESIGALVALERKRGNLSDGQVVELADLLQSRFGPGERAPGEMVGTLRDVTNMSTIANPVSAVTQLGDVGVATYLNGMKNTFAGMFGKKAMDASELGIMQELAEEFTSRSGTAKALQWLFKTSGFRNMDKFGKNTLINGAHRKWSALSKGAKGQAMLKEKYGEVFGDSFPGLVSDLKDGRMTENVKFMLWNELSDAQPISLSEVPKKYLDAPNGRIFYALKTFMLKQLDIVRRDMIDEYKKGNKVKALKNAAAYTFLVGGANTGIDEVKDLMIGGEFNPENIASDKIVWNALKNFGGSEYEWNSSLSKGKAFDYFAKKGTPPLNWINAIGEDIINMADPSKESTYKSLKHAPVIGKLMYHWFTDEGQQAILKKEKER